MTSGAAREAPGVNISTTTARREWLGWFGAASWLFFMMYGYDTFTLGGAAYHQGGTLAPFLFMLVCAISMAAYSFRFGRDPNGLSKVVFYTAPAAIVITAVFPLLPEPYSAALFILSPVLFAPALIRRVYGVMRTATPGKTGNRLKRYMTGIAACFAAFVIWIIARPPKEISFIVPALLAVPAWAGVRRFVTLSDEKPKVRLYLFARKHMLLIAALILAVLWLNTMNAMIHASIVNAGIDGSPVIMIMGYLLPPIGYVVYGVITDKGQDRDAFIGSMLISLIGMIIAFAQGGAVSASFLPLVLTEGFGGAYTGFFILGFPVFCLIGSKRPVIAAASGVIVFLTASALSWTAKAWLPGIFSVLGTGLLVSKSILIVVLMLIMKLFFELLNEKALALDLHRLLYYGKSDDDGGTPTAGEANDTGAPEAESMINAGFTKMEIDVAMLLIEDASRSLIERRLHISATEIDVQLKGIREKVGVAADEDPAANAIGKKYGLTRRETDMLRYLYREMTNDEIASELFLSEETIRIHVRNLLKKLSIINRRDVRAWVEAYKTALE
jgi:DNA-binding CsgD family transcriptional regulator